MSEVFPDPRQQFLGTDPRELKDPLQLTPAENQEIEKISHGTLAVAAGLAAAYLVYRKVMSRRVKEEVKRVGPDIQAGPLLYIASGLWNAMVPKWVSMTAPYLLAGYVEGVRDAHSGKVPTEFLDQIARGYAEQLGHHINDVSLESLVSGFQAQVNRKIPPFLAARRAADAYGVPKRGMNALVNVWISEDPKKFTDRVLPSAKEDRARVLIETQQKLRARQIGDNEEWTARTQAKQIVWMYGQDKGVIPSTARRVWITASDERVCQVCGPMDGVAAPVGEKFDTANGTFWTPPTHVNCRCDVVLDLNMTENMQAELTALLEAETVSKARPGDPYDRDNRGRFAVQEARPASPVQSPRLQRKQGAFAERKKAREAEEAPVDLFTEKKPDLLGGKSKDILAGRGRDLLAGRGEDIFAEEPVEAEAMKVTGDPLKPAQDRFKQRDPLNIALPMRDLNLFTQSDIFKDKQAQLFDQIDLFIQRTRPTLVPDQPNWKHYQTPLIALLEPRHATHLKEEGDSWDSAREYEELIDVTSYDRMQELNVKPTTKFWEWHRYDSGPDKAEHPVMKRLEAYWKVRVQNQADLYGSQSEDNYTRIRGSDGAVYIITPDAYATVLHTLVFDSDVEESSKNSIVWLSREGYEGDYSDIGSQVPWETRVVADKMIAAGDNPWDWIDSNVPTLIFTDWVGINGEYDEDAGSYAGWRLGAWTNPGKFRIEDVHADFDEDNDTDNDDPDHRTERLGVFARLPVRVAAAVPDDLVTSVITQERLDDEEMHRDDSWDD